MSARKRSKHRPSQDQPEHDTRRERIARHKGKAPPGISGIRGERPILRFVVVFGLLMAPFSVFYYAYFSETDAFKSFLHLNAAASGAILRAFGTQATVSDGSISSPQFSLSIELGCDAILPAALFLSAVFAFPVSLRTRLPGMLIGTPLLLVLNLVRIVTLYYTGVYLPSLFKIMHIDVWQAAFICLALLFWVIWMRWSRQTPAVASDVAV